MRNLIILGSGRSGTSAVAGLFRKVPNIFYGYDALEPTPGNRFGYYEDEVVNALNNVLIRQMTGTALLDLAPPKWLPHIEKRFSWMHRDTRSLWMARPTKPLNWRLSYDLAHLMGRICAHQPFCLKDPRFGFTLPLWRPYLPEDTRFLVVFRDPDPTVKSMLRDARALYEPPLPVTETWCLEHWRLLYTRVLEQRDDDEAGWLFVNSDEVISGAAVPAIEAFADCAVDTSQLDGRLLRAAPAETDDPLYHSLCEVAAEDRARWAKPAKNGAKADGAARGGLKYSRKAQDRTHGQGPPP